MNSIPVSRRTRLQRAILNEEQSKINLPTRRSTRRRVKDDEDDGDDDDDIKVVDESEYNRRVAALKTDSVKQSGSKVDHDGNEEGKDAAMGSSMSDGVSRRTRLQRARLNEEEQSESCIPTRRSTRSRVSESVDIGLVKEEDVDEKEEEYIKVVDESEYNRRVALLKADSLESIGDLVKDVVDAQDSNEGKDIETGDMSNEVSDGSLQIIGETHGYCYESRSSVTSFGTDDETVVTRKNVDVDGGGGGDSECLFGKRVFDGLVLPVAPENNAPEDDFVAKRTRSHSHVNSSRKKRKDGTFSCPVYIDDESHSSSDNDSDDGHDDDHKPDYARDCERVSFRKRGRPRRNTRVEHNAEPKNEYESESESEHGNTRVQDNAEPENESESVSEFEPGNTQVEDNAEPESESESEKGPILENNPKVEECEYIGSRKRRRLRRSSNVESYAEPKDESESEDDPILENEPKAKHVVKQEKGREPKNDPTKVRDSPTPKPLDDKGGESVVKKKRGRPSNNKDVEIECNPKTKKQKLKKSIEVENVLLDTILGNSTTNAVLEQQTHLRSVNREFVPLKFISPVKNSVPVRSKEEEEIESLFNDLDFALRTCDIGCSTSCSDEDGESDDVISDDGAVVQGRRCCQGKHYLILDDQVGFRCKYCPFIKLEMRYVTPDFDADPFGRSGNRNSHMFPHDSHKADVSNGLHLPEFNGNPDCVHSDDVRGTVWDLVPGVKPSFYPHQQEAFEFIWKNVGGTTKLEELSEPSTFKIGGCIICHAPGTGKTRLAITFLQSFIKKNPMSRPVIISPSSMLLTWEEEFARWKIDVPFHNLNKAELSGKEDEESCRSTSSTRQAKLCSWAKGKGILGISYRLFDELAGERKDTDGSTKKALLEGPGILVMDEGHIPRNGDSNIWNVLKKVRTKRRIILSGTPFQNNFDELHHTLSLVRDEFRNPASFRNYWSVDRKVVELKKRMKPFVHVHKGEILKKMLRGLCHSVVFLMPSDMQKTCCQQLTGVRYIIEENHLVSVACVHPSLLNMCNQVPSVIDKELLEKHKEDVEVGLKIKFLLELINLAVGEKILVFSQYLQPLNYIADLMKSRYHWTDGKDFLYMKGQQATKQRQSSINLFNDPTSKVRVMLASIKACGEGIHLIGASRVVLLDVVWNPSVERQAISRAYRIGQLRDVFVYHLILSGTMEEKKYHQLKNKSRISELVFSSEGDRSEKTNATNSNNIGLKVSEDRVLEEMVQNEKTKSMFVKIVRGSGTDEMIKSFNPVGSVV